VCLELAELLLDDSRFEEAEELLKQAIRLDHAFQGAFCNRFGNHLARLGHHKIAVAWFQQAMRTDPENSFYRRNMEASLRFIAGDA
jgi:tetratricopeptide (TPR) repeat protein